MYACNLIYFSPQDEHGVGYFLASPDTLLSSRPLNCISVNLIFKMCLLYRFKQNACIIVHSRLYSVYLCNTDVYSALSSLQRMVMVLTVLCPHGIRIEMPRCIRNQCCLCIHPGIQENEYCKRAWVQRTNLGLRLHLFSLLLSDTEHIIWFFPCTQCKHQLAARLAVCIKRCPVEMTTDAAVAEVLVNALAQWDAWILCMFLISR